MHNEHHTSHEAQGFGKNTNGLGIFIVAVVFIVIGLFTWWLWNNNHKEFDFYRIEGAADTHNQGEHGTAVNALGALDTITGNYIYELGEEMEIILPDSAKTKMMVGRNSTEAKLYAFLSNDAMVVDTVDKTKGWITCDRIFFESGQAVLTENSVQQIERLAAIIKAYPNAEVKVGGYTDTTGSAEVNTKLSGERALTVANGIQAASGRTNIVSEGYGPLHPIADNSTPEGRAMNRRVDLRVTKK
jgi:outer membrane protein OmpA-like peptidoglycan-associated protein